MPYLSICIPSYNRYNELERLLYSIDSKKINEIEIIIREDNSPNRKLIRKTVENYKNFSKHNIQYIENEDNFGYDKNLRLCANSASGEWVIFMGDDDIFIEKSLDMYIDFLKKNENLGYVLRRYKEINKFGTVEEFRYSRKNEFFKSGQKSVVKLFRRSVFISGFTFKKKCFNDFLNSEYDGTLLFQLYIQASVCLTNDSAYCDIPLTQAIEGGIPYFGVSNAEKELYDSESITFNNSINFLKQVPKLTRIFDKNFNSSITDKILKDYSKYSYGFLHVHRDKGIREFFKYSKEVKNIGMARTIHYYIYFWLLLILGNKNTKKLIIIIKKIFNKTPIL